MQNFIRFIKNIWSNITLVSEVMACLLILLCIGGVLISYIEKIPLFDGLYFALITGLAIGYGDITPETFLGKILSIAIGIVGLIFIGLIVAIATHALEMSAAERLGLKPIRPLQRYDESEEK